MLGNTTEQRVRSLPRLKITLQIFMLSIVFWGGWRVVGQVTDELKEQSLSFAEVDCVWLAIGGVLYLFALLPSWLFWHRVMQAMRQQPRLLDSFRAFFVGNLGKYVPGKVLVVVLRTGLVKNERVDASVAALGVFIETLTMMAVGGCLAAGLLPFCFDRQWWLTGLALGLMLCSGIPTVPPIFRQIVRIVGVKRFNPEIEQCLQRVDWKLMVYGWSTITIGWCLMGTSLWATLEAVSPAMAEPLDLGFAAHFPLLVAAVSLSMVAGFLSLLPGGVGARELVVVPLLQPQFGLTVAVTAAALLRISWMVSEAIISIILYLGFRRRPTLAAAKPDAASD